MFSVLMEQQKLSSGKNSYFNFDKYNIVELGKKAKT